MTLMKPEFTNEESVRLAVERRLRAWNIPFEREVDVGVGQLRADIVTPDTVIEVKRVLTRSHIYQAKGQGLTYCSHLGRSRLLIIGQAPSSQVAYQQVLNIRSAVREPHVQIVFIDREPWKLEPIAGRALPLPRAQRTAPRSRSRFHRRRQHPWFWLLLLGLLLWATRWQAGMPNFISNFSQWVDSLDAVRLNQSN